MQQLADELMGNLTDTVGMFLDENPVTDRTEGPIVLSAVLALAGATIAEYGADDPEEALRLVREKFQEAIGEPVQ